MNNNTPIFPIFHNQNTISLDRLSKLLITWDPKLIKRHNIPIPQIILRIATFALLYKTLVILHNDKHICPDSTANDYRTSLKIDDIIIRCEAALGREINREISLSEFQKYFNKASRLASQNIELTTSKN